MEWLEDKNFSTLIGNEGQQYSKLEKILNSLLKTNILFERDINDIAKNQQKFEKIKVANTNFTIKNVENLDNDDPIYINIINGKSSGDLSIVLESNLSSDVQINNVPQDEEITLKIQNKKVFIL